MSKQNSSPPPSDEEILEQLRALYQQDSSLGAEKIFKRLLVDNPQWEGKVGLKVRLQFSKHRMLVAERRTQRIKHIRNENGLLCTAPGAHSLTAATPPHYPPYRRTVKDNTLNELLTLERKLAEGEPLSSDTAQKVVDLFKRVDKMERQ